MADEDAIINGNDGTDLIFGGQGNSQIYANSEENVTQLSLLLRRPAAPAGREI